MFIKICGEYGVSNDLTKWRNQKYFSTWQSRAWETVKPGMSYINENSFSRWIIEKSDGLLPPKTIQNSKRLYIFNINESNQYERGPIVGHEARNLDAQQVFLNSFENIVNRRVNIPEDIRRFQKTLQYARSKVDYAIGKFTYMLPGDMNLRIGKIVRYNNKILIASPSIKIRTNVKINLDAEKDKPDVRSEKVEIVKTKPNIKSNEECKENVKMMETEHDMNKITYEEEK